MTETVVDFAAPFPAPLREAVSQKVANGAAVVMIEAAETRQFRRDPAQGLRKVSAELARQAGLGSKPGTVVCCYRGDPSDGLDVDELSAVLGRRLHVDAIAAASTDGEKRVLVLGTLREERLGLAVVVDHRVAESDVLAMLEDLSSRPFTGVQLLVSSERLRALTAGSPLDRALSRFGAAGGSLGLWVPETARTKALTDPRGHVEPWKARGWPVPLFVRFEPPQALLPTALDRFMGETGIKVDASMPIDDGAARTGAVVRDAAYTGSAPYRPQPFDLRVPLFRCDDSMWIELPPREAVRGGVAAWWTERTGPSDAELALLLDSDRWATFDRRSRVRPEEVRHYADFRIYNWPAPAPAVRASLLVASTTDLAGVRALLDEATLLAANAGASVRLVDAPTLHQTAVAEVTARFDTSAEGAIELQAEAHEYLRHVPFDAPLRQDYAEFARFVPPTLGRALEIGSGYGVLAWTLAPRATQYLCLDLDARMFDVLRPDLGQRGLVADMQHLPLAAGSIDSVVANNVIEHLYDPLAGLIELRRVLRHDGRVLALLPLDALDSRHELPAHHWKIDTAGIGPAFETAGYTVTRFELVDLYQLGVRGAFPSCHGMVAMVEARPATGAAVSAPLPTSPTFPVQAGISGRLLPAVREQVRFEQTANCRVVTLGADPADTREFRYYGAQLVELRAGSEPWPLQDASVDLVYAFLTVSPAFATAVMAEAHRVLVPGGRVVLVFRNRESLRYQARVRSYYGAACDLATLGLDGLAAIADGAGSDAEFVSHPWVTKLADGFRESSVTCTNLSPDDLPGGLSDEYPAPFWRWLSGTLGRFLVLRADR